MRNDLTKEEQRVLECLCRWLEIREQNGILAPKYAMNLRAQIDHSALLKRLLSGKEPLPEKPPLEHGYPVYPDD